MTINLTPDLEAALKDQASRRNATPEELALEALRERFLATTSLREPGDDWERRLRSAATDCGVSLPDGALSSEGLYE